MSVWHTGDNSAQIYNNRNRYSSKMGPNNNEMDVATKSQLEFLMGEFERNHAENVKMLVKSVMILLNGSCPDIDFKTLPQVTIDAPAQTYSEHKAQKEGNNEVSNSDWNDQPTNNNNSRANQKNNDGDGWGINDNNSSSGNNNWNDNRNQRRDNQSGRGGFNGGQSRPPREPKPGDWKCSKCNANNFAGRTQCFRRDCGEPKGEADSTSDGNGGGSGNWKRSNNNNNWGGRSNDENNSSKKCKVEDDDWGTEPAAAQAPVQKKVSPKDDDW
jgi:hypothetical protein